MSPDHEVPTAPPLSPVTTIPLGHASTPGLTIPVLGFGVWEVPDEVVDSAFAQALEIGYRHIDTARVYRNEPGVGRVLASTTVPREDIFVTTKVWNNDQGNVPAAFDASMGRLGIDVLDLYLIHWPAPAQDEYVRAWAALLELQQSGRVRSVGVCNFQVAHLERLRTETGVLPSVNQVELSPYLQQEELREFHAENGIVTEAWSPLAARAGLLEDPVLATVAAKHAVSPAQVALRWQLQLGHAVLTRSVQPERIEANADLFGFELDEEDLTAIRGLDRGLRTGPDPDAFG